MRANRGRSATVRKPQSRRQLSWFQCTRIEMGCHGNRRVSQLLNPSCPSINRQFVCGRVNHVRALIRGMKPGYAHRKPQHVLARRRFASRAVSMRLSDGRRAIKIVRSQRRKVCKKRIPRPAIRFVAQTHSREKATFCSRLLGEIAEVTPSIKSANRGFYFFLSKTKAQTLENCPIASPAP